jgi:hypothetical protein
LKKPPPAAALIERKPGWGALSWVGRATHRGRKTVPLEPLELGYPLMLSGLA